MVFLVWLKLIINRFLLLLWEELRPMEIFCSISALKTRVSIFSTNCENKRNSATLRCIWFSCLCVRGIASKLERAAKNFNYRVAGMAAARVSCVRVVICVNARNRRDDDTRLQRKANPRHGDVNRSNNVRERRDKQRLASCLL